MRVLLKECLLVSMGMGIGVVLMGILNVGKEADYEMKQLKAVSYTHLSNADGRIHLQGPGFYIRKYLP